VTVPKAVREALGLQRVRAISPLDRAFLQGLEGGLQEWNSAVDEAAFADL